jgi:hypothetical protein
VTTWTPRPGGHQGLALAGLHFGDLGVVEHHAADQLDVEVAHAQHPLARLPHHREGLGQQLIEQGLAACGRLGLLQLLAELGRQATQLLVTEGLDLLLQQVDVGHQRLVALQLAGIGITQQQLEHGDGLSVVAYPTIAKPWPRAKNRAAARVLGVPYVGDPHLQDPPAPTAEQDLQLMPSIPAR